jgi:hypothetical protein
MGKFLGYPFALIQTDPPNLYKIDGELVFETSDGRRFTVPSGFVTDGATTKIMSWLVPPWGHYQWAAIIHDYLIRKRKLGHSILGSEEPAEIDAIFLEALRASNLPNWFCLMLYSAVRTFGWPEQNPRIEGLYDYRPGS